MRNLAIFAIGALALILVGCATLRDGLDCANAPTLRRAAEVTIKLLDGRCPVPKEAPAEAPRPPEPDVKPQL